MKKIIKLIIKLMLATVIAAAGIGLTSCQSSNIDSSTSEKNNSENKPSSSSSESSKSTQTSSNNASTSKMMSTIETAAKYIRKNYTSRNLSSETAPYSYKITSQTYKGYKTEVYAFADSEVYSNPNEEIWIKVNTKLDNYYMSIVFPFSKFLEEDKGTSYGSTYVFILLDEPNTVFTAEPSSIANGKVAIPWEFNSNTKILFKYTYNFESSIVSSLVSKSTAESYAAIQIDFGLQYVSAFLNMIGCSIKDLGFTNY